MATIVDPPEDFLDQFLEGDKWTNPDGSLTPQARHFLESLNRFNNDMWERSGGSDDEIAATSIRESYAWDTNSDDSELNGAKVQQLYPAEQVIERPFNYHIDHVPKEWRNITVTGGTYAALDHDFINAKSKAQITFPEYPDENSVIIIRNGDGSRINFDGNGRYVNRSKTGSLVLEGTAIEFHYFIDTNEWFAR